MMQRQHLGFTLVEVMIVVALIGVLAVVAIPRYHTNILKSQMNRAASELGTYKNAFELRVAGSGSVSNSALGYVPSNLTDGVMAMDIGVVNPDGSGHIEVTMGGNAHPNLSKVILRYVRDPAGRWVCEINRSAANRWRDAYRPNGCTVL